MSAALDDWCKAWLRYASTPVASAPPDVRAKLDAAPDEDRVTTAVLLRFELVARCQANQRPALRDSLEGVSQWLARARQFYPWHPRAVARRDMSVRESPRDALNAALHQHVLNPTPWTEQPWHHPSSDSLTSYLWDTAECLCTRLGTSFVLAAFRAVRAVSAAYWRAGIAPVQFGADLAHAIEHFGDQVEAVLGEMLNHFPVRWLPFVCEAALDERGARRYAQAVACHLDIILTAGDRKNTFALLRERQVIDLDALMRSVQPPRPGIFW